MKFSFLCSLLAGGLLFAACQKDEIKCEEPSLSNLSTIQGAFVSKYGAPAQQLSINPAPGTVATVTTGKGARIQVPAGAFLLPDGSTATGAIQLTVREITTKPEMILSNMPTTSGGQMLISGGQYYFKATQNNQRLRLKPTARLGLRAPIPSNVSSNLPMDLFFGSTTTSGFDWQLQSPQNPSVIRTDSLGYYNLSLYNDSLGWVNCDRFMGMSPLTTVTINIGGGNVDFTNTMAFLVFDSYNSAARNNFTTGQNSGTTPNVPVGLPVTAVVIRFLNGQYYFGKQAAQVTANMQLTPTLRTLSEADLLAEIRRL